jgi:hypothetical protein
MNEAYLSRPILFERLRSAPNSFAHVAFQHLYRVLQFSAVFYSYSALRSQRKIASCMHFLSYTPCIVVEFCYEMFCWKSHEDV